MSVAITSIGNFSRHNHSWYAAQKSRDYSPVSQCLPIKFGKQAHVYE